MLLVLLGLRLNGRVAPGLEEVAAGLKVNGDEVFADGACVPNAKLEAVLFVDEVGVEELKLN